MTSRRAALSLPLLTPLFAACSPLGVMNALVPKDPGSYRAAADIAYGPHPRHRFDVYAPTEPPASGPPPLLVFLYGGSWRDGNRADYGFVGRAFAARGYLTAVPDYRVVPEVRYPDFLVDCGRAVAEFQSRADAFGGAPGPVFLVGHSAGAYNAVMLALADDLARSAGLERASIAAVAGLSGPYDFLPLRVRATEEAFEGVDDLEATQPVNRVDPDAPPMLLANGTDDDIVLVENIHRMGDLLEDEGIRVVTHAYENLGHAATLLALARPLRWRADVLGDVTDFFAEVAARKDEKAAKNRGG